MFDGIADEMIKLSDYYLGHPVTWISFGFVAVVFVVIMAVIIISMVRMERRMRRMRGDFDGHHRH